MRTTTNVELTRTERDNLLAAALVHAAAELRHAADQFGLARGFDPVVLEDAGKAACDAREALDALAALGFGEES